MSNVRDLIGQFQSETSLFKRIDLMRDLSEAGGPDAVATLGQAMVDADRMVRENAARFLGEIGSPQAHEALIQGLGSSDETVQKNAAEVLGRAQVRGALPALKQLAQSKSWSLQYTAKRAIEAIEEADPNSPAPSSAKISAGAQSDYRELIQQATINLGGKLELDPNGAQHQITLPIPGGRKQIIYIVTGGTDSEGSPLILAYTVCAPATQANHERALIYNMRISYGALAITDIKGQKMFVMVDALLASSASADELRKAICSLARHGDKVEKNLTGQDIH